MWTRWVAPGVLTPGGKVQLFKVGRARWGLVCWAGGPILSSGPSSGKTRIMPLSIPTPGLTPGDFSYSAALSGTQFPCGPGGPGDLDQGQVLHQPLCQCYTGELLILEGTEFARAALT